MQCSWVQTKEKRAVHKKREIAHFFCLVFIVHIAECGAIIVNSKVA
jgi:hypothetical protein